MERLAYPQEPGRDALDTLVRPKPEMARLLFNERLAYPQEPGRDALDTLVRQKPEMARYIVSRTFAIVSVRPV